MGDRGGTGRDGGTPGRDTGKGHRKGTPGWETGGDTGETPERHQEGRQRLPEAEKRGREDPQRTLGNLAEDPGQRRTAGRPRRGHWTEENCREISQRTLDSGELQESAPEGPARHTRSAPRAHLESHRHFADGKAPAAVGYDGYFPAGSVPDIEQVIHEGVGVTAYDKVKPAGLRHEGDVVLIAKV